MKVSYRNTLVFVALSIVIFLASFFLKLRVKSNNDRPSPAISSLEEPNKTDLANPSLEVPAQEKHIPSEPVQFRSASRSKFDTPEQLKALQEQVLQSGSFISWAKRQQDFRESGFDTVVNFESAKRIINGNYPEVLDEESVTKRVLALEFLKYSSQINRRDCLSLFSNLVGQYQNTTNKDLQRAIQFDVGSLVYSCTEVGGKAFRDKINGLTIPILKGQSLEAQINYKENKKRS